MKNILALSAVALSVVCADEILSVGDDWENTFEQICDEHGYKHEHHTVITKDGYKLGMYRISGKQGASNIGKPPVILQHGILDSSDGWAMNTVDKSLAFIISDEGYDIWLSNSRGNKYSRAHISLDPDWDDEFWDFDWEDMGTFDVPANIEYVKKQTNYQKVIWIAHSQGSQQTFYALSNNSKYLKDNMSIFIGLGPVANLKNCKSGLLTFAANFVDAMDAACYTLDVNEFFPYDYLESKTFGALCSSLPDLCKFGDSLIADERPDADDAQRFSVYMAHNPSGTSRKCIDHDAQIINSGIWQRYDYGDGDTNKAHYGQSSPPEIVMTGLDTPPVAMFVGTEDELADVTDTRWMRDQLGKNVIFYKELQMGHLSFMVGKSAEWFKTDGFTLMKDHLPTK